MVSHEHICLFHCSQSLDKMTQKYIKASLQFQYKQLYKDYKDAKTMDKAETKYHVIRFMVVVLRSCHKKNIHMLSEWLGF